MAKSRRWSSGIQRLGGISADADPSKFIKMRLARRVEQPPASMKIGFKDCVEVWRDEAVGVATDEARGYPKSAAEYNCKMRKIAANACPLEKGFVGGRLFRAGPTSIFQMIVNPAANCVHSFVAGCHGPKLGARECS